MSDMTYAQEQRHGTSFFIAGKEDLLGGWFLVLCVAKSHTLEDRAVQHDAQSTVSTHDHATMLLSGLACARVNLESSHTTLFPLAAAEVEKLAFAGEEVFFFFLTSLNCDDEISITDQLEGIWRKNELVCS